MRKQKLLGAIIGAGRVSQHQLDAWEQIPEVEIVAIADVDLPAAQKRGEEFGIKRDHVYPNLKAVLKNESQLDFVDIATPVSTHPALVETAAKAGMQVLCQKPFAYSLLEAQYMTKICQQAGVTLMINENWRWRTWYREIKSMLEDEAIGRPLYAKIFVHSDHWVNLRRRTLLKDRGHGTLMEWGIHHLDVMRFLFGEADSVYGRVQHTFRETSGHEQRALVIVNFKSGVVGYLDISSASFLPWGNVNREGPMVEDVRIEGDQGTILLLPNQADGDRIRIETLEKSIERPAYEGAPQEVYLASYAAAQHHFVDCLLSGQTPETHAEENYETLALTLAAYHSAETNQVVRLDEYKAALS